MKVSQISVTNFKGKIIDSHFHSGQWKGSQRGEGVLRDYTPDIVTITEKPLKNGDTIEKVVISNAGLYRFCGYMCVFEVMLDRKTTQNCIYRRMCRRNFLRISLVSQQRHTV